MICARRVQNLEELKNEIDTEVLVLPIDVTSEESVLGFFSEVRNSIGSADILINNAGTSDPKRFKDLDEESWNYVLETNLNGDLPRSQERNGEFRHKVEMGPDGYPMVFMTFNKKKGDQVSTEIKPYRLSFVRAALMVTSARQEAQLQVCCCGRCDILCNFSSNIYF